MTMWHTLLTAFGIIHLDFWKTGNVWHPSFCKMPWIRKLVSSYIQRIMWFQGKVVWSCSFITVWSWSGPWFCRAKGFMVTSLQKETWLAPTRLMRILWVIAAAWSSQMEDSFSASNNGLFGFQVLVLFRKTCWWNLCWQLSDKQLRVILLWVEGQPRRCVHSLCFQEGTPFIDFF